MLNLMSMDLTERTIKTLVQDMILLKSVLTSLIDLMMPIVAKLMSGPQFIGRVALLTEEYSPTQNLKVMVYPKHSTSADKTY